jgi:hypothetical protein
VKNVIEIFGIFFVVCLVIVLVSFLWIPFSLLGALFIFAGKQQKEQKPFWFIFASFSGSVVGFSIAVRIVLEVVNPIYLGIWSASYAVIIYSLCAISPLFLKERY